MKDEIKEMNFSEMLFNRDERLLDYITNLQEELKSANESITWWSNRFKEVERENEKLKYNARGQVNDYFKDKYADEVLKNAKLQEENERLKEIINILNGGDEEC